MTDPLERDLPRQHPQAMEAYRFSPEQDPVEHLPVRQLAQIFFETGMVGEAVRVLLQAVEAEPEAPELWSSLGWSWVHLGNYPKAMEALQRALILKPGSLQCIKSLALASFAVGKKESSREYYETALSMRPGDEEALFGLGILFISSGNLKSAYRQYEALHPLNAALAEDLYAKIVERKDLRLA